MIKPPLPANEAERLATLHELKILDTPPEERYDRITRFTQRLFDVPIALVSLVDANRQWFKSRQGFSLSETPRDICFSAHAVLGEERVLMYRNSRREEPGKKPYVLGHALDITERQAAERRLAAQHAATRVMAEANSIPEAMRQALRVICEALGWEEGAFWAVDQDANVLRCAEYWRVSPARASEFEAITRNMRFPAGIGLPGRVWSRREPAWIPDVVQDTRESAPPCWTSPSASGRNWRRRGRATRRWNPPG